MSCFCYISERFSGTFVSFRLVWMPLLWSVHLKRNQMNAGWPPSECRNKHITLHRVITQKPVAGILTSYGYHTYHQILYQKIVLSAHTPIVSIFRRFPQNCEKRLLASSWPSVCLPSVHLSVLPHGITFFPLNEFWFKKSYIWVFFENLSRKIQVLLKSQKNNGHCTWRSLHIYDISLNSS